MTNTSLLPSYQRFVNGVPVPLFPRRAFRPREKYLILLVFLTFGVVCFGTFFFLPDFRSGNAGGAAINSVYRVYQRIQKAGPELLIPAPPHTILGPMDPHKRGPGNQNHLIHGAGSHADYENEDAHLIAEKQKLQVEIFILKKSESRETTSKNNFSSHSNLVTLLSSFFHFLFSSAYHWIGSWDRLFIKFSRSVLDVCSAFSRNSSPTWSFRFASSRVKAKPQQCEYYSAASDRDIESAVSALFASRRCDLSLYLYTYTCMRTHSEHVYSTFIRVFSWRTSKSMKIFVFFSSFFYLTTHRFIFCSE